MGIGLSYFMKLFQLTQYLCFWQIVNCRYNSNILMFKILKASRRLACLYEKLICSMAIEKFVLHDLGEKIKQGKITMIHVKQGQRVNQMDELVTVQSDKQIAEITAPFSGIVTKIHYKVDDVIQVGSVFFQFETQGETSSSVKQQAKQTKTPDKSVIQTKQSNSSDTAQNTFLASSTVIMLAKQYKIDLNKLKGTGKKGRILKDDIIYYLQNRSKSQASSSQQIKQQLKPKIIDNNNKKPTQSKPIAIKMNDKQISLSKMINYSNTIPHLYYQQTFDVTQLKKILDNTPSSPNMPKTISLFSILLKTFSLALNNYPQLNSTYNLSNPFAYHTHQHHNIAIPSYNSDHLQFNCAYNVNKLNIYQIQQYLNQAHHKTSSQSQLNSSTILVSNIGDQGILAMNPIIYGNNICHANIGSLRQISAYVKQQLTKRYVVQITMGCDHRVLDGATVARFTSQWRQMSQNPTLAFLKMI